jgi:hypothetical protein
MQAFLESPMARMNCHFEFKIKDFNHLKQLRLRFLGFSRMRGCCPNENLFERSLKRFLFINLGEVEEKRFQLFEPEGRVLESPGTSLRFIKKCFRASEK